MFVGFLFVTKKPASAGNDFIKKQSASDQVIFFISLSDNSHS